MGKRTVKAAAPVPAIDDALDLDDARHDLGRSAEDGEEGDHEFDHEFDHDAYDASVSEYELLKQLTEHDEQEGGAEGSGAETASPVPAKAAPVRDVLSKVVEVPAHVQAAFDDAADIMNRAFPAKAETAPDAAPTTTNEEQPASPPEPSPAMAFAIDLPGTPTVVDRVVELNIDDIAPDPEQPRLDVDTDLADSIAAEGVKQPIVVRVHPYAHGFAIVGSGKDIGKATTQVGYIIVDGERRWRASVKAARKTIPARVVADVEDAGDRLLLQVTLNEGKRLAPMEEARAWKRIMDAKSWNIQQLATALGRAKSTVSDRLALLDAPKVFQDLFAKGQLSAAAAPIVREYREVPERILKDVVKDLLDDEYEGWGKFTANGVPVPVDVVKQCLEDELLEPWGNTRIAPIDKKLAGEYTGAVATIKGKKYATDVDAYRALQQTHQAVESSGGNAPTKREPDKWELERRAREKKERIAHEKKRVLRRAQFDAISPKLPATLDGNWALLLITWLTKEIQQDYQRVFLKALDIEPTKRPGQYGGFDFQGTIIREAEKLAAPARVKFALALLIAHDLNVSSYDTGGADRLAGAAKLLKVDLAKVKAPDSDKAKKPAAKKAAKKGRR